MLNEDRIELMTKMAAYENRQGKKDISVNSYFRGDYISFQVLKSALYATVGFALAVAMYILYDLEGFLTDFYKMDIAEFVKDIGVKYGIVLVVYLLLSYFIYAYRFGRAKKHIKKYVSQLKELEELYEWE
ncbi:MAG: hypothetical protein K6E98_10445 [Lachnospiraceae bacterium]|nr:hypothetical protein [Lachnospiraceae bacterium]